MTCMGSNPDETPPHPEHEPLRAPSRKNPSRLSRFCPEPASRKSSKASRSRSRWIASRPRALDGSPLFLERLRSRSRPARPLEFYTISSLIEIKASHPSLPASSQESARASALELALRLQSALDTALASSGFSCESSAPSITAELASPPPAAPAPPAEKRTRSDRRDPAAQAEFLIDDRKGSRRASERARPPRAASKSLGLAPQDIFGKLSAAAFRSGSKPSKKARSKLRQKARPRFGKARFDSTNPDPKPE